MASGDEEKGKLDLLEDNRIDSGIDSYKSFSKDEHHPKPGGHAHRPGDDGEVRDKLDSVVEERHDSAYISTSITVDSLTDILEKTCSTADPQDTGSEETSDPNEGEVDLDLLTTITDDGDTYVQYLCLFAFPPQLWPCTFARMFLQEEVGKETLQC